MTETGFAYDFQPGTHLPELTLVGRGTPMGELFRRYWQPVSLAANAAATPRQIRVLGEDLILFRDDEGRPGLLYPRCCHRGASLYLGKVEARGLRCCYHGWLFDVEGRCLEQPCEPQLGLHRDRVRQPWYPVREHYGLIWAYMGPPSRKPRFPVYDIFEHRGRGEQIYADDTGLGGGGPEHLDFNWLSHYENLMDPFHVPILHARFSGNQFVPEMAILPEVEFTYTVRGVRCVSRRAFPGQRVLQRVDEAWLPNLRLIPDPRLSAMGKLNLIGWVVPRDEASFQIFTVFRSADPDYLAKMRSTPAGKPWQDLTELEHQAYPGDYEVQKSQGRISLQTEDHLTTTDQGVAMVRRQLSRHAKIAADGGNPGGITVGDGAEMIEIESGNYLEEPAAGPVS